MKIRLLTITHKTPAWIKAGYEEYAKRLPPTCALELIEIPAARRTAIGNLKRLTAREGERMLAAMGKYHHIIALDSQGASWTTEMLANKLKNWHQAGRDIDLLIGGPDGLSPACREKAVESWSISPLTFPHLFMKLLIAEQIYRAYTILTHHPYHR